MSASCEKGKSAEASAEAIEFEYYIPEEPPDCLLMDLDHARIVKVFPDGTRVVIFKGNQFSEPDFRVNGIVFQIKLPAPSPTATETTAGKT